MPKHEIPDQQRIRDVVIVGAGPAGLSAAIYLGRALRHVTVVHHGRPMLTWEPDMQNYLGFPDGIDGDDLLARGMAQARKFDAEFVETEATEITRDDQGFTVQTCKGPLRARRVLVATGIYHRPPDIPGVSECLGHSLFFCKDCDGWRVRGKTIAVIGRSNEAADYAFAMLPYSPRVMIATNGEGTTWDEDRCRWLKENEIPVHEGRIAEVEHVDKQIQALCMEGGRRIAVDVIFTARGDTYHNQLVLAAGAEVDAEGQVTVDADGQTTVPGLYAAGCLTPANCQAIIAAGQGAQAAQGIHHDLWREDLKRGCVQRFRQVQIEEHDTLPEVLG